MPKLVDLVAHQISITLPERATRRVSRLSAILLHQEQAGEIAKTQLLCVRMSLPRFETVATLIKISTPPGEEPDSGQCCFHHVVIASNSSKSIAIALQSNHFFKVPPSIVP